MNDLRLALCTGASFAVLAACGMGSSAPLNPSVSGATSEARANSLSYGVLYSFKGSPDGSAPIAGLINVGGTFYGTTTAGGMYGGGTVFEVTASGKETVLYSFGSGSKDGSTPVPSLLNVKGRLYGTTIHGGGANNDGTVFSITTSGKETVLHSFPSGSKDGTHPYGALINVNGMLYGTTGEGGSSDLGTVFAISTSGKEHVLHSFSGSPDGMYPYAGLIDVNGTFYGTTQEGGAHGFGTVFSINSADKERVLHSFAGNGDGDEPIAGLLNVKGTFYGTTSAGGSSGWGTVFSIKSSGKETVLHSFYDSPDGMYPFGGLTYVEGRLYGTTEYGGTEYGTVFAMTTSGNHTSRFRRWLIRRV
jgi:uncharacterized repeat protein (TIGR03803 family)